MRIMMLAVAFLCVASCGAVNYKYFVLNRPDNKLMGKDPKDDLSLDVSCDPDSQNKAKCIVMFTDEFFKSKQELLELRKALDACERGAPPR